jgi:hypothetical protein
MTHSSIIDLVAAPTLLLFTGADVLMGDLNVLDIISKFGVVAVIWYMYQETKKQAAKQELLFDKKLTEIAQVFDKESIEIRGQYEKMSNTITDQYKQHTERMETLLKERGEEIRGLQDKLYTLTTKKD